MVSLELVSRTLLLISSAAAPFVELVVWIKRTERTARQNTAGTKLVTASFSNVGTVIKPVTHTHTHMCARKHIPTHARANTHTHTHTHTHTDGRADGRTETKEIPFHQ